MIPIIKSEKNMLFEKNDINQLFIRIDGIDFVTAAPVLEGKQGDISKGGSGYDTW